MRVLIIAPSRTQFRYDALGRLTKVIDAAGKETGYGYDELGNRITQTDANSHTTGFQYDKLGRETRRTLPDGAFETKGYDAAGNLETWTDFMGRATTFDYDPTNRLQTKHLPGGANVGYSYTATGRRQSVTDSRGTTSYGYDNRDRLTSLIQPGAGRLEYGYDANSNRTSLTARVGAAAFTTTYGYDDASRLDTVTDPNGRVYDFAWDQNGNRASLAYPNATATTYGYDDLNRLRTLTTSGPGGSVQGYSFTLGAAGNRERIDEAGGTVRSYSYDNLYRLNSETVTGLLSYQKSFTYDDVGNRGTQITSGSGSPGTPTAPGSIGYSYDVRDRLLSDGSSYGYDHNGNLISKSGEATYTFDAENRLIRVNKVDGSVIETLYDADGNRVQTRTTLAGQPTQTTNYLVDTSGGLSHVVADLDATGTGVTALYVRGGDDLLSVMRASGSRFYHSDGIGSIRKLTDETGTMTDAYEYSAFGEQISHTGSDPQPYAFAGEPYDPNSGFQYHRARWMDPSVGRFVGMDPFGGSSFDPPSLHRYVYANADPLGHIDPTGEFSVAESGLVSGIISALSAGTVNAVLTTVFNGIAGQETSAVELRDAFLIGAITAPVGGAIARAFAPLLRTSLEPFLIGIGSLRRVTLVGTTSAWERFLVKFSRLFFNTNVRYPPVTGTPLGQALKRLVPSIEWQQHHIFIQQAWSRVGSQQQLYNNVLANEGLRRIGNGLWNLIPIPASINNWLGRSPIATQMIASIYYAVMVFGPVQAAEQLAELDTGEE